MVTHELIIGNTKVEVMRFYYTSPNIQQLNLQIVKMALDGAVANYVGHNQHDTLIDATDALTQILSRTVIKYL
jgi:hypothetical protein